VSCTLLIAACGKPQRSPAQLAREGRELFESSCAACHGVNLKGTDDGPSFLDPIYAPNHHPDEAFYNAVKNGVQPHHWNFGAMPPQPRFTDADIEALVAYVRSEQREAGVGADQRP
jgi:mono/diheme cytochrome c family protein